MDFEDGLDLIDIPAVSREEFDEAVSIIDDGDGNTLVSHQTIFLTLVGIDAQSITIDDFVF